jgi:hypothetical protein
MNQYLVKRANDPIYHQVSKAKRQSHEYDPYLEVIATPGTGPRGRRYERFGGAVRRFRVGLEGLCMRDPGLRDFSAVTRLIPSWEHLSQRFSVNSQIHSTI